MKLELVIEEYIEPMVELDVCFYFSYDIVDFHALDFNKNPCHIEMIFKEKYVPVSKAKGGKSKGSGSK
jgi:hypothetical protein